MRSHLKRNSALAVCLVITAAYSAAAQTAPTHAAPVGETAIPSTAVRRTTPSDYVIGPDDQLSIVFWRDKDMSGDVVVRPDGIIALPLINEIQAAGFTPDQLRAKLVEAASKFVEDPNATVIVKEIHSRNVFITGSVAKPGTYQLSTGMRVVQLIAVAGGLQDYADAKKIVIMRAENGQPQYYRFNYEEVLRQKRPDQNILLKPGDTVLVP